MELKYIRTCHGIIRLVNGAVLPPDLNLFELLNLNRSTSASTAQDQDSARNQAVRTANGADDGKEWRLPRY